MVSNSKILTVSYGTFSCTLEGFDDSFDTMKAIAEYFRDLAADDRYFGAEPPTPDADMLARIAEKEIARRVEAHEDAGKIHLRADALAAPTIEEVEQTPVEEEAPVEAEAPSAEEVAAEEIAAEDMTAEAETSIQEIEATVAEDALEDIEDTTIEPETSADDAITASIESAMAEEVVETAEEGAAEDAQIPQDIEENLDDAILANMGEVSQTEDPAPAEDDAGDTAEDDDDSVAARLRRIRSVVAGGPSDFESDAFSEDEHAQDFLNDTVSDLDAALMADAPDAAEMPERVISDILEDGAHDDALDAVAEELGMSQDTAFEDSDEDIEDLAEDTLSQLLADAIPEDSPQEDTAAFDAEDDADDLTAEAEDDPAEDLEVIQTRPLRARVIKMKRSDFEAAVADGGLEESFDVLEETDDDGEPAEAILSPEDEADLQSELDAVTAELEAETGDITADENAAEEYAAEEPAADDDYDEAYGDEADYLDDHEDEEAANVSKPKGQMLDATDRPVSRLFNEAQSHLSTPEATRRRNAIQHLRAAVEANQAETNAGSALRTETDEDAYRSDIADAMRGTDTADQDDAQLAEPRLPTRPRSRRPADQPTERPAGQRPAPLQLVAEQRVDVPQDPVRPRRVSAAQMAEPVNLDSDAESFRDFAEDIGATDLPDLLEAAAAYVSDVEGMPQFSRRMLMGKLDEYSGDDFSREDRLKSFGLLLRHGKLQKLKGGQFTVTDETEYRTEARNAG
ncbi:MAG: hypothetical protein AAF641_05510 [Pseudomonadota bacterium]